MKYPVAICFLFALLPSLLAQSLDDAEMLVSQGRELSKKGAHQEAIGRLEAALEIYSGIDEPGLSDKKALVLSLLGDAHFRMGRYGPALEYFEKALQMDKSAGYDAGVASDLMNIGAVRDATGDHLLALESYEKALVIYRELGREDKVASSLSVIGVSYASTGRFDLAIDSFQKALAIAEKIGDAVDIANSLNNIGNLYQEWGHLEKALDYYERALSKVERTGNLETIATLTNSIGYIYLSWGRFEESLSYYERALAALQKLNRKDRVATVTNGIGSLYAQMGRFDQALSYFEKALALSRSTGDRVEQGISLNNIATVYANMGRYPEAVHYYGEALEIQREMGNRKDVAKNLNNIGVVYGSMGLYRKAAEYFTESVAVKEELRRTAAGGLRREYLASQLHTYQLLVTSYIRSDDPVRAFDTLELSSAKYLAEQLGERADEEQLDFEGIEAFRKKLGPTDAVIGYSNVDRESIAQIVVTSGNIRAVEVDIRDLIAALYEKHGRTIQSFLRATSDELPGKAAIGDRLRGIVEFYRHLLSRPGSSRKERLARQDIAEGLYNLLISSLEQDLAGKSEVIIIPDGILAFLPFETLIAPDGRYLVERFHIRYAQSLTVTERLSAREYDDERKPLLAFGGAVYNPSSYAQEMMLSESDLERFEVESRRILSRGGSIQQAYESLGLTAWDNLPASLVEIRAIGEIYEDAVLVQGTEVSEARIKDMSESGFLRRFKVLHFATHGAVVPQAPELSALVLSLSGEKEDSEDGYLTMREITELDLNADFVNLSACETGLGKLYGGEGVVGLTQAFLIAGANGLSVSLWQVADESTMLFMAGLYRIVKEQGLTYSQAMTEMKRKFLSTKEYRHPFFWAPFVYYGL